VALLVFAEDATDPGGLEDYARLMHPKIVELNVPIALNPDPSGRGL
jgi:hypothetical protein